MPRKRTKQEALDRLKTVDVVPDVSDFNSPRLKALADQLEMIQGAAKVGAAGLIMLDPLNRLADETIVVPVPMIAIPAHEAYRLSSNPSMQIYIRAGETIVPTGGNVQDVQEVVQSLETPSKAPQRPRKPSRYSKAYKKAFAALKPRYTLKSGKWKKDGFKRCVKAAHAQTKKELK